MGTRPGRSPDGALHWPEHGPVAEGTARDHRIDWAAPAPAMRPARRRIRTAAGDDTGEPPEAERVASDRDTDNAEVTVLRTLVADLQAERAELRAENAALRRQLGERPLSAPRVGRSRKDPVSRSG